MESGSGKFEDERGVCTKDEGDQMETYIFSIKFCHLFFPAFSSIPGLCD